MSVMEVNIEPVPGTFRPIRLKADRHNRCCGQRFWCIKDIFGLICAIMTWSLLLYAEFVVVYVILQFDGIFTWYNAINMVIFQLLAFLAVSSHIRTMLSDPGAVPRGNATRENIQRMGLREGSVTFKCPKCCCIKPERAHHCSVCQRCIRKMDHHCPWVNNCVGENNQKFFVLFTFYIAVISIHALFLAINHFLLCIHTEWKECSLYTPPSTVVLLLFLVFEAVLFAIFTAVMFGSQIVAIWNDETGIESLKKEEARWVRKSKWKSVEAVFGRFGVQWFSPFTPPPLPCKDEPYMYSV
ncbi:unnamed protein product [Darwinula stevensoni]|uniref:Palmitoyltransferase n=1 Tax=Darwinula stevensoni TaxID=69355 RepID=A0A7R8X962_9CRUS|nr:unnamed protein product [Darwinula stevensoni]CAG0890332.1 unnamed protein product [Darwinula stevensoni]